jgi:hypothetical protein
MIDLLVLLTPLALLPVILIFGFTGCVLDRHGHAGPPGPKLFFPSNLDQVLSGMTVTVTLTSFGPPLVDVWNATVLELQRGVPHEFNINIDDAKTSAGGEGAIGPFLTLKCECALTFLTIDGTSQTTTVTTPFPRDFDDKDSLMMNMNFVLSGGGSDPAAYSLA